MGVYHVTCIYLARYSNRLNVSDDATRYRESFLEVVDQIED